ncbi:protein kinase [Aetokthonos hydrillicola Thurmond2011]|jgi:serine/threonine-protein kinase|uniref:non-specific serine/threonine protein kinase n=1 Tax=Aetokthonos hydrillicola Thurmond2011 TaxID=2712845 RepID=A0AAP5MAV0_9CYAN|nr:serine/threonine-protein kinase [Aetokthonos hydrillicola]MBO3461151.1 protein kinase [Aetokthonos hydrillicola CCALA 1050]MBW4588638.1 protein kinase [Aetokthonos hydrillicola CCALA 1050]MDR9896313.1 protein kinase [Aetokthonos hydrillicola Thurmond2011]
MTTALLNNRYQVIQVLGSGGFGETFLAEDTYMPSRRRCVIKQLKPVTNDPQAYKIIQQRFEREAATLEYLGEASDQIPTLYAYFSENGQFYLVQEWIHGLTLTEIVKINGRLSESAVREILLSLLSVLDYVHSKGIIHRDIKPDNIILRTPTGSPISPYQAGVVQGKPILIDFGAVKEMIRSVVNPEGYATKSLVIGTPGYMPSEQAVGRPVYASDIYSLGLTAIYLLTGKQPYALHTNPQNGEILWQYQAPQVSQSLATILSQSIKPHASDRYTTASKMLYAVQSAGSIPPTVAPTTGPTLNVSFPTEISPQSSQPSGQNIATGTAQNWQKPTLILGSLVVGGLIGALTITSLNRQPTSQPELNTSPTPGSTFNNIDQTPSSESPKATLTPTNKPTSSQNPVVPKRAPKKRVKATPTPTPSASQIEPQKEPVDSDDITFPPTPTPSLEQHNKTPILFPDVAPTPQNNTPSPTPEATLPPTQNNNTPSPTPEATLPPTQNNNTPSPTLGEPSATPHTPLNKSTTSGQRVPAFPTGTPRSSVEATLGKPAKDSKGAWDNTRAVTYFLVPNQIDLGYLFDRKSGKLRQTEVAFAQSVDPKVMQRTLAGMLGGEATEEAKRGLRQVHQRKLDSFRFIKGSLKGQIVRQECDLIYISVWSQDLHDFVNPSQDKKC